MSCSTLSICIPGCVISLCHCSECLLNYVGSSGGTNGFEFCNCHAVVQRGRKLKYPPALAHLSSALSAPCDSCLLEVEVVWLETPLH